MSKEFLLDPNDPTEYSANDYEELTLCAPQYTYYSADGKPHLFGYCTDCKLKVFWSKPKKPDGDYFFRHVKGYYSSIEQMSMLFCSNYRPSKGISGGAKPLDKEFLDEIFDFLKENGFWVYQFINAHILNGIGRMSTDFFIHLIHNIFVQNANKLSTSDKILERILPYNILALMSGSGNIFYKDIKRTNIQFEKFQDDLKTKHSIHFFNYIHFSLRPCFYDRDYLGLEVIKSHDYGKPLLLPKVLHTIEIPIDNNKLLTFLQDKKLNEYRFLLSDEEISLRFPSPDKERIIEEKYRYLKVKDAMEKLLN